MRQIGILFLIVYAAVILTSYGFLMVGFPGYVNNDSLEIFENWFESTQNVFYQITRYFWLVFNILSTIGIICAIKKLHNITKTLS